MRTNPHAPWVSWLLAAAVIILSASLVAAQDAAPTPTPFVLDSSNDSGDEPVPEKLLFSGESGSNWDVYVYDFQTGQVTAIAEGPGDQWAARWVPGGESLLYLSSVDGVGEVWSVNADGSNAHSIYTFQQEGHSMVNLEPTSREGRFYLTVQTPMQKQLYRIDTQTGTDTLMLNGISAATIDESPNARVWVTDNEAVPQVVYTEGERDVDQWEGDAPSITHDASDVVYQAGDRGERRVEMRSIESGEVTRLSPEGVDASGPTISADGSLVCWQQDTGEQVVMCQRLQEPRPVPEQLDLGQFEAIWYLDLAQ